MIVAPALLALALALSLGSDGTGGESAFLAELEQVHVQMRASRFARAEELLADALAAHARAPYVLRRRAEIEDDLFQCAFGRAHPRPEPRAVVRGELHAYAEASGQMALTYRFERGSDLAASPGDFAREGDAWMHPARFTGPHTIELRARLAERGVATLLFCSAQGGDYWCVQLDPAAGLALAHVRAGAATLVATRAQPIDPADAHVLVVDVGSTRVSAALDGGPALSADKPRDAFGRFGVAGFAATQAIALAGPIASEWIEGRIDAALHTARAEFERGFDRRAALPAWLAPEGAPDPAGALPGPAHPRHAEHEARLAALLLRRQREPLAALCAELAAGASTREHSLWVDARVHAELGERDDALAACAELARLAPDFAPAAVLAAELSLPSRSRAESLAAARALVQRFPAAPDAHACLARALLRSGQVEAAGAAAGHARAQGLASDALDALERLLVRAARGPAWTRSFEWSSRNFTVRSDLSRAACLDAARVLEQAYLQWNVHLRRSPARSGARQRVFLFAGETGYRAYVADVLSGAPENSAGLYAPALGQLLVWVPSDPAALVATLRHEGFHQYLDDLAGDVPVWLTEGLAEYYEQSELVRGAWHEGAPQAAHARELAGGGVVPLERFLALEPREFYAAPARHYAEAWALVHYLRHGSVDGRRRFDMYLDALIEGRGAQAARALAFGDVDLDELARELERWAGDL